MFGSMEVPAARLALLLRAEGALECVLAVVLYAHSGASWWTFGAWFLAPDLAMLGYLGGAQLGARLYNATHSYVGPAVLVIAALSAWPAALPYALIWFAHIGFDRALGYGLKSVAGFRVTHLGAIGHAA